MVEVDDVRLRGTVGPQAVKRTRVLGYHGQMRWVKCAFDVGATVLRWPRLPEAEACFAFVLLTHLEVEGDDPALLEDLLREPYRRLLPRGLLFMAALVPRGSPREPAGARWRRRFGGSWCRTPR